MLFMLFPSISVHYIFLKNDVNQSSHSLIKLHLAAICLGSEWLHVLQLLMRIVIGFVNTQTTKNPHQSL